jgi:hypothetical protein
MDEDHAGRDGVNGGGLVRAIVPKSATFAVRDHFGYADPNGSCQPEPSLGPRQQSRVAQWIFGAIARRNIEGWLPYKVDDPRFDATGC